VAPFFEAAFAALLGDLMGDLDLLVAAFAAGLLVGLGVVLLAKFLALVDPEEGFEFVGAPDFEVFCCLLAEGAGRSSSEEDESTSESPVLPLDLPLAWQARQYRIYVYNVMQV
jgi:hypothetical protein